MAQKKLDLVILAPAREEILEIARLHLELVGPNSARKVTNKLRDALESLRIHPRLGRMIEEKDLDRQGFRKLIVGVHLCFYRQIGDAVYVYHIVDGRTNYPKLFTELSHE